MWAMQAVKCSEVRVNGPEDGRCPGHLQRAARGHGDAGQLTERENHVSKKQLPSAGGQSGELRSHFFLFFFFFLVLNSSLKGADHHM